MPNEFTVVGENRTDTTCLLVVGADGKYYGYFPGTERLEPVEPDDAWTLFADPEEEREAVAPKEGGHP